MRAKEIFENYMPEKDKFSQAHKRKPSLTLSHLNELRQVKEKKKKDLEKRIDGLSDLYNPPEAGA